MQAFRFRWRFHGTGKGVRPEKASGTSSATHPRKGRSRPRTRQVRRWQRRDVARTPILSRSNRAAPKGPETKAQGNALGTKVGNTHPSPARAAHVRLLCRPDRASIRPCRFAQSVALGFHVSPVRGWSRPMPVARGNSPSRAEQMQHSSESAPFPHPLPDSVCSSWAIVPWSGAGCTAAGHVAAYQNLAPPGRVTASAPRCARAEIAWASTRPSLVVE